MKKALFSMFCTIMILLFLLIFFTLYGRLMRQTEINHALEHSMQASIQQLLLEDGIPTTTEEWTTQFIESIALQIESQSDLTVHIYEADITKGILCAEAVLFFEHPIGTSATVTTGKRTIILDKFWR